MAKIYDVNRIATNGGATSMFYLKETLKSAGWAVSASSDGFTHFSASDGISTDASGSNGMNNNRAWFWIVAPDGRRGFTAQRGSGSFATDDHSKFWRIDWCDDANLISVSGNISCSVTFTNLATKGRLIHGSGSTTAPSHAPLYPVSNSVRTHITAYNTPNNGVYGFYHFCSEIGTTTGKTSTIFCVDPILSGSTPANIDTAPYVVKTIHSTVGTNWLNSVYGSLYNKTLNCPFGNSAAIPNWGNTVSPAYISGSMTGFIYITTYPFFGGYDVNGSALSIHNGRMFGIGSDMFTGAENDLLLPIMWVGGQITNTTYANKYRGYAGKLRIHSFSNYDGVGRKFPDTINLPTDAYICVGSGLVMPWPENIPGIA